MKKLLLLGLSLLLLGGLQAQFVIGTDSLVSYNSGDKTFSKVSYEPTLWTFDASSETISFQSKTDSREFKVKKHQLAEDKTYMIFEVEKEPGVKCWIMVFVNKPLLIIGDAKTKFFLHIISGKEIVNNQNF